MQEESKGNKYIIINNFKVFVGLLIICKKTTTIDKTIDLKNNEEFDQPSLYTSVSRSTKKSYINLIDYKPQVSTGYIYKITDNKGKIYIGSTIDYKKRWKQHKEAGEDMPLHRAIKDKGIEIF